MTHDDSDTRRSESWHATSTDELFSALATDETGLSADEAAHRLSEYDTNDIHDAERESALGLLVSQVCIHRFRASSESFPSPLSSGDG